MAQVRISIDPDVMSRIVLRPVEYSPPPPWYRRRRLHLRVLLAVTLLVSCAAVLFFAPLVKERMDVTSVQARCLAYRQPEDRVAYLFGLPGTVPACYTSFAPNFAARDPAMPVMFMHERRSPAGHRRLVVIHAGGADVGISAEVVLPGSILSEPKLAWSGPVDFAGPGYRRPTAWCASSGFSYYWGQVDPTDPSRFSIRYDADGQWLRLDGLLRDDDTVELTARAYPELTKPAQPEATPAAGPAAELGRPAPADPGRSNGEYIIVQGKSYYIGPIKRPATGSSAVP